MTIEPNCTRCLDTGIVDSSPGSTVYCHCDKGGELEDSIKADSSKEFMTKALLYQELLEAARRDLAGALELYGKATEQLRLYRERAETAERERDAAVARAAELQEDLKADRSRGRQVEADLIRERDAALAGCKLAEDREIRKLELIEAARRWLRESRDLPMEDEEDDCVSMDASDAENQKKE